MRWPFALFNRRNAARQPRLTKAMSFIRRRVAGVMAGCLFGALPYSMAADLTVNDPTVTEGTGGTTNLVFTVTRTGDVQTRVVVGYQTSGLTATAGDDYTEATGTLTFMPNQTTAQVTVAVATDALDEANETVKLTLTGIVSTTRPIFIGSQRFFNTGASPNAAACADFNGDGRPDVATANYFDDTVSILLNTTAPGATAPAFAAASDFSTGVSPSGIVVADFNLDGKPDVATADSSDDTVSVLLNTTAAGAATPNFSSAEPFDAGSQPRNLAVGDFNGDGKPDLAVATYGESNCLSVLLNSTAPGAGTPTFVVAVTFMSVAAPSDIAVGDINGDGKPDVVAANGSDVCVLRNTAAAGAAFPTFAPFDVVSTVDADRLALADFNGDGRVDIAVTTYSNGRVSILRNATSNPTVIAFGAASTVFDAATDIFNIAAGDLNGDGRADIVIGESGDLTMRVLENQTPAGSATLTFGQTATFGNGNLSPTLCDFNGDGKLDIAASDYDNDRLVVLLNRTMFATGEPGGFQAATQAVQPASDPYTTAIADFNGDDKPDVIAPNAGNSTFVVLRNTTAAGDTAPSFAASPDISTGLSANTVAAADFNGDGKPDLVFGAIAPGTLSVIINNTASGATTFSFASPVTLTIASMPNAVIAGDVNNDGRPDIIAMIEGMDIVSVLVNTAAPGATPAFASPQNLALGTGTFGGIALADFNNDGKIDLAVSDTFEVSVAFNTTTVGSMTIGFTAGQTFAAGAMPGFIDTADFNGDGRIDLAVGDVNVSATDISVLLNTTATGSTTPSFGPRVAIPATTRPFNVAAADFNNDSQPDILFGGAGGFGLLTNTATVGSTAPSFALTTFAPGVPALSGPFATGDINSDGRTDVSFSGTNSVSELLSLGAVTTISDAEGTGTINDDDNPPTVSLSAAPPAIAENGGTSTITATLSEASGSDIAVTIAFAGTATISDDFTASSTTINIPAGDLTGSATVTGVNDSVIEGDETISASIAGATNATAAGGPAVVTITDDDPEALPTVSLSINPPSIAEAAGVATVTATLSAAATADVTVNLAFAGTATNGDDYTPSAASITIPTGSLTGTAAITAVNDTLVEGAETVGVSIASATNATAAGDAVSTTITDDEVANRPPSVESVDATPNPAKAFDMVAFSVAATDPDGNALTYAWDFGDGSTGSGATPTHVYTVPNIYTAKVTVSDGAGGSTNATVVVTVGNGNPDTSLPLTVTKLAISLDFTKSGKDSISLTGVLPVPAGFIAASAPVSTNVGGVTTPFTLDKRGKAKTAAGSLAISIKTKKGVAVQQNSKFQLKLSKGSFSSSLADEGLTSANASKAPRTVRVEITFNGNLYRKDQPQTYTSKRGKGKTK